MLPRMRCCKFAFLLPLAAGLETPALAHVRSEVSPGVTVTVQKRPGGLVYRFDLAAGADPRAIRMRYQDADEVAVEDGGRALRVRAGGRTFREQGLRCYQVSGDVACRYLALPTGEISFSLSDYDGTQALVIDPEISWGTYLGGTAYEGGRALAVDASGNVYVTGQTYSYGFPTTGGFDTTCGDCANYYYQAFVTKVDAAGANLVWSSYLGGGGSTSDYGYGVAVDSGGNAYVTGYTESSDFPIVGGFQTMMSGFSDAFVVKVDASGSSLAWSSYLGGTSSEYGYGIGVDASDNVLVAGYTFSPDFPVPGGFDTVLDGGLDAFVTKVDATGASLVWSSFLGGSSSDQANGLAVDGSGNAYVAGYTFSPDFPVPGGFDTALDGGLDAFVTKVDSSGSLAWSSFLGGTSSDYGYAIAVDAGGNAYVTGYTYSTDFPSAGGFDTMCDQCDVGYADAFVTKVDSSGSSLPWSSYLGGSLFEQGNGVAVDANGGAYIVGLTYSSDFPTVDAFNASNSAYDYAVFVTRVDPGGASLSWSSYLGGASTDYGYAIALGPAANVYVTGETYSTDFPTPGGYDTMQGGGSDVFVARIVVCGNGVCEASEDPCDCPADCGADTCGNGCCGATEDPCTCAADCPDSCGNGCCGATETACDCPDDCGADTCGNGCCGATESECTCPADCEDRCGDGCCTGGENPCFCPQDCPGAGVCGNGCADPGETACNCPEDTIDLCGDGCCTGDENCATCSFDCGECTEPTSDGGSSESSGCGCRVGASPHGAALAWLLALVLAGGTRRRRK
jgi:MYXO-CTERM domain-containing protein